MAISTFAQWRLRVGGNDNNGGGFDPSIVGAGTDYTEQDVAQLALTDLATASASASVTSAAGGFTAAMIGNAVRIVSGTNFTVGTYFITAVASANAATLDRACSTAAASGGVANVGGALASFTRPAGVGAVNGNTIFVRGQGSLNPVDIDYSTAGIMTGPTNINYVGYNGRPKVAHNGILFNGHTNLVRGIFFVQTVGTNLTSGVTSGASGTVLIDCVLDSGGNDATQATAGTLIECLVMNSGNQTPGTRFAVVMSGSYYSRVVRTLIKDQRGGGVSTDMTTYGNGVTDSIIQNCGGDGIAITGTGAPKASFTGNTIHGNAGHGINVGSVAAIVMNNLITGHTGSGKYGLFRSAAAASALDGQRFLGNNYHGNTDNSNYALDATETTLDPQYVNAPLDLTPTNLALRRLAGVGAPL